MEDEASPLIESLCCFAFDHSCPPYCHACINPHTPHCNRLICV